MMVWSLFIIDLMGLFFYTKISSIISIGDLPTTNIIEPKKNVDLSAFFFVSNRLSEFKNDDWKGKQKLFSLATRELCDIALPRGMSKHKVQNMTDNFCLTFLYDRGLKELALCQID